MPNSSQQSTMTKMELALSAKQKMATGALLRLDEVAALLDVAESTVFRLPLNSVRIGRSLRFAPVDVQMFIDSCREFAA